MQDNKHTPGPWHTGGCVVWEENGGMIADLTLSTMRRSADETEANARLIAAAPDLLAACEMAMNEWPERFTPCYRTLKAAIAKATEEV